MSPEVSIVVPCYNDGSFLIEAIQSASRISAPHCTTEIIVVDDGSTDAYTAEVLRELEKNGIVVLYSSHRGPSSARNQAIAAARGSYILPLDADNRLRSGYLVEGFQVLKSQPSVDVVYGDCLCFGQRTTQRKVGEFDLFRLIQGNFIDTCAIYRKALWDSLGGYDERIRLGVEDWDFWLRAVQRGSRFHYLQSVCFDYRYRADSLTNLAGGEQQGDIQYIFDKPDLLHFRQIREGIERTSRTFRESYSFRFGNFFMRRIDRLRARLPVNRVSRLVE